MPRPKSDEKRSALLEAATRIIVTQGLSAPTAAIAREAGIANGSLFTYFETKDALLNALYLEIEGELAAALAPLGRESGDPRERARGLWNRFIDWGAANPLKRKALRQLKVSERITAESRRRGDELFREVRASFEESFAGHVEAGRAPIYLGAVLEALAEMTIELVAREPARRHVVRHTGRQRRARRYDARRLGSLFVGEGLAHGLVA